MRIEKEPHKVILLCREGVLLTGNIHKNISERVKDFLNDPKEEFIAVTDAHIYSAGRRGFARVLTKQKPKAALLISKKSIILAEDI